MTKFDAQDAIYREIVLAPLRVCTKYKPKFGQGRKEGLDFSAFQKLYQADPFYSWFGLDHPLMYAAHKAAGGMTSIYRQIGIGCERLFRQILIDTLKLEEDQANWSYKIETATGRTRTLYLDGRIPLGNLSVKDHPRVVDWIHRAAIDVGVNSKMVEDLEGSVFEVRQGYKSKDAKRQNADLANASTAYVNLYLPCAVILSNQIDTDIKLRYRAAKWSILTGTVGTDDDLTSTYAFMRKVVGYDFEAFFNRNTGVLREQLEEVLVGLLEAE